MAPCQVCRAGQETRTRGTWQGATSLTCLSGEPWPCYAMSPSAFWLFRAHPVPVGCFPARLGGLWWLQEGPAPPQLPSHPHSSLGLARRWVGGRKTGGAAVSTAGTGTLCPLPAPPAPPWEPLSPGRPPPQGQQRLDTGPGAAVAEMERPRWGAGCHRDSKDLSSGRRRCGDRDLQLRLPCVTSGETRTQCGEMSS